MENSSSDGELVSGILKVIVFSIAPTLVMLVLPVSSHRIMFGLSMFVGILLQALIPPRKKGLLSLLTIVAVFTVVYSMFWK